MSLTVSAISEFMGRFGENQIYDQIENKAPELKLVPSTDAEGERVDVFNIHGGFGNVGLMNDGGTLFSGGAISPVQGIQVPSIFFARVSVPRATAKLTKGAKAGVDLLNAVISAASTRLARAIGRSLIDPVLSTLTPGGVTAFNALGTSATGDVGVEDVSGFRAGDIVGVYDESNSFALAEILRVNYVTPEANGIGGTINVTRGQHALLGVTGITNIATITNLDQLKLYAPANSTELTSISKLASDDLTVDCYGIDTSADAPYFTGNRVNENGALDDASLRELHRKVLVRSGEPGGFVLASPSTIQAYVDGLVSQRQFRPGDKWDGTGKEAWAPEFDGMRMESSTNCPNTKVFILPKDPSKLQLRWQQRPKVEAHGEVGKGGSKTYAFVSSSEYVYDQQIDALCSVRCTMRSALGELYGIT